MRATTASVVASGLSRTRRRPAGRFRRTAEATLRLAIPVAALIVTACAPKTTAPVVTTPRYPDYLFPTVPAPFATGEAADRHGEAWQFLQAGDLRAAEREFGETLKRSRDFYPADAGLGYVALAQRDFDRAVDRFNRALARNADYVPALVGKGDALLAAGREADALEAFERAVARNAALSEVRRRVEVLRARAGQEAVVAARQAEEAGRYAEARLAYDRAIAASPASAFLYRELAVVEQRDGNLDAAAARATRAIDADPADPRAFVLLGEIEEARGNTDAALRAYGAAQALEPGTAIAERLARVRARAELDRLPAEYRAIPDAPRVSRGDLAALLGVRLGPMLDTLPQRATLITDGRRHWASEWILVVVRAGVMDGYPNHTFQPDAPVRRADLATAIGRIVSTLAARDPRLRKQIETGRVRFADVPASHLSYDAAATAVASSVLPPLEGGTFQPGRFVTGREAVDAIERLAALAGRAAGRR